MKLLGSHINPVHHMSLVNTHKPIRIYMGGLILADNTMYMFFAVFSSR